MVYNLILFLFLLSHPFYVSIMEVAFDSKEQSVEISKRIFFDDLEEALILFTNNNEIYILKYNSDSLRLILSKYFSKHIFFSINNQIKRFNYLGQEYIDGVFYCYLEIPKIKKIKNFKIKDNLLLDVYEGQENIVYLNINNKKSTFRLKKFNNEKQISY